MKSLANECGARNGFGYYDMKAREIVLKRPCFKKKELEEAYEWIDRAKDLRKLSISIGPVEQFVADNSVSGLYTAARGVIKQSVMQSSTVDNDILQNALSRIFDKQKLTNLSLRCFVFSEDYVVFGLLLDAIRKLKKLIYLDLTGCYFTDEQLIDLATVIAESHIAHLVWPEPRMAPMVLERVAEKFNANRSVTVIRGVPLELEKRAADNRNWLFSLVRKPSFIQDAEIALIKEYENSMRLGLAYEKQRMFDLEKAFEAAVA